MTKIYRCTLQLLSLLILVTLGTFSANATPQMYITPNVGTIDMGTTTVGTPVTRVITLYNYGTCDLHIYDIETEGDFTVLNPPLFPVPPGTTVYFHVRMDATSAGTQSGRINYYTNAYNNIGYQFLTGVVEDDTPPPPAQVTVVQPNADAHIVQETPDKNVGTQAILRIRHPSSGAGRYTFLRFNVPAISGTIQSAVLRIRPQTKTITAASIYDVGMGWGERTITWNNWQSGGTTFNYLRETGTLAGEQWHEIDVKELIPAGGGTITIGITTNQTTAGFRFYSRESAFSPTLEITSQ